jgi:hypothetical protein
MRRPRKDKTLSAAAVAVHLVLLGAWSLAVAAPAEAAALPAPQGTYRQPPNAKVLHNDDVVAMTRAKLGGDLIILAIERSPDLFTITPEALIALKSQGVGDAVIAAMLKATVAAGAPPRTANYLDYQPGVTLVLDEGPLPLRKAVYETASPSAWKAIIPGQHPASTSILPGPRAATRVATATPAFEVRLPASLPLASSMFLFHLHVDSGHRELERELERPEENRWGRAPGSRRRDDLIRLAVEPAPAAEGANHGMALYFVSPQSPLPPGEYVLVLGPGPDYYDFGVDR